VPTELELDHVFWKAISTNVAFQAWFLDRTKLANHALELVGDEKWHQRWYRDPVTGEDSETDILLIFKDQSTGERFAIHIENKPPQGVWEPHQPENYRKRAANRMSNWRYVDFQVVLIAPTSFIAASISELDHFDIAVSYEALSVFVPEFGHALEGTESMGNDVAAEAANSYIGQLSDAAGHLSLLDNPVPERPVDDAVITKPVQSIAKYRQVACTAFYGVLRYSQRPALSRRNYTSVLVAFDRHLPSTADLRVIIEEWLRVVPCN
jgi:hypothetical protein